MTDSQNVQLIEICLENKYLLIGTRMNFMEGQ